jgi:CheY-like chemotaxis protein
MATFPLRPTALVVEDEELIRMLAVDGFLDAGFVVLEAEHAAEALQIVDVEKDIHVLFTDVNMPGEMNGIDLAEHLTESFPSLKIIITSALPVLRSLSHLPVSFVAKPYDIDEVCETARALLAA